MDNTTRKHLAEVAGKAAQIPFHGDMEGKESNLEPIIRFFPNWTLREADGLSAVYRHGKPDAEGNRGKNHRLHDRSAGMKCLPKIDHWREKEK